MVDDGQAGISCANCGHEDIVKSQSEANRLAKELEWSSGDPVCPECKALTTFHDYTDL